MRKSIYIILALLMAACTPELPESPETLVVEGWIENGAAPVVFVTSSVSTSFQEQGLGDLIEHVALDANVTVTHNGVRYPLKATINKDYFLTICYTSKTLKGETGGTYRLEVDWKGLHAEAETTIPAPGTVDSIVVEHHPLIDTSYVLKAHINPAPEVRYYRFFSMAVGKDSTYAVSYNGTFDSELREDELFAVNRGRNNPIEYPDFYYTYGDSVRFKLASIDAEAYDFWTRYDESVMFSHAALIPYSSNIRGNINGGLGYWFGYGISTYTAVIR
jgi:hypothetical protein